MHACVHTCVCHTSMCQPSCTVVDPTFHEHISAVESIAHTVPRSATVDSIPELAYPDGRTRGHTLSVPGVGLAGLVYADHGTMRLTDSLQSSQQGTEPGSFQLGSFTGSVSGQSRGSGGLQGSVQGRHDLADLSQYSFSHESSTLPDGGFPMEEEGEELEEVHLKAFMSLCASCENTCKTILAASCVATK